MRILRTEIGMKVLTLQNGERHYYTVERTYLFGVLVYMAPIYADFDRYVRENNMYLDLKEAKTAINNYLADKAEEKAVKEGKKVVKVQYSKYP